MCRQQQTAEMEIIMNKIPCDVIRDLLPLYKDDVCSENTKNLIEEHLPECEECREYLEALDMDLPTVVLSPGGTDPKDRGGFDAPVLEDIEIFKKIAHRMSLTKVVIGFLALTVLVMAFFIMSYGGYPVKLPGFDRRIAADDIQVTALYQLEDGDFYITLESGSLFNIASYGIISSPDGLPYSDSYSNGQSRLSFEKVSILDRINSLTFKKYSFVIPCQEILNPEDYPEGYPEDSQEQNSSAIVHKNTRIYYEGKNDGQFTIWQTGQEVKPAPESIEEKVRLKQDESEDHWDNYLLWAEE